MERKRLVLSPKQGRLYSLLEDPNKTRILCDGGARSTKTIGILAWLIKEASTIPGARILCARKYLDNARTTLFNLSFRSILGGAKGFQFHESTCEIRMSNGSLIRIGGFDDADRVDKILGDEYMHVFVNEATQITWDTLEKVKSRLSQSPEGSRFRKLILDCNPKGPRHWLYQAGVRGVIPNTSQALPDRELWARMHWTPYDNPYLPPDTLATLEALTGVQRRRLLKGEWCENEGAVYDEFDEDIHVIDQMPPAWDLWRKIRGIDFGYTNPFVRLCAAIDPDGRLYFYRERYVSQVIVQEHAKVIKAADVEQSGYIATAADHDAEDRATLHAAGIMTIAAKKDIRLGISAVKARLRLAGDGKPRIFILRGLINTITEFAEYSWPAGTDGKSNKEVPIDADNHAMDAIRYIVMYLDNPSRSGVASGW